MTFHMADDDELPDAGEGMCCIGAAALGPGRCTCWEPVFDLEQRELQQGPAAVRETACADCAFRPGSPEQQGDARYAHSRDGELEDTIGSVAPFVCHQGMRRMLRQVHPVGAVVEHGPMAYCPPTRGYLAYCANGEPAAICAGWAARTAALARRP